MLTRIFVKGDLILTNQQENIQYIISKVSKNIEEYKMNYIIAIDGYSCSGKTSLTEKLIKHFENERPTFVFHIDDYIRPRKYRYGTGNAQWFEHFFLQWDTLRVSESLFKAIKDNETQIKLHHYCKDRDSISEYTYDIPHQSIIIIEGVFLQRIEWRKFFDYVIFVDCPREIRFQREIIRSNHKDNLDKVISQYQERYWAAEDYYDNTYNPLQSSDLIISNYQFNKT